jgi:NADH-quinone oxidoreductase subunit D
VTDADESLLLGVGVAADLGCDRVLELNDYHPSAQPGFQLRVVVRDGLITDADPRIGLMHRGAEKLFEVRDYRQIMMLANRHDWLSAFSSELGIALVVEAATGITPPERASWIRTLLAEANRISVAFAFLGPVAPEPAQRHALFAGREALTAFQERVTGGRVHPMFTRIGGVARPLDSAALDACARLLATLRPLAEQCVEVAQALESQLTGLALLTQDDAIGMGTSGPVGRASGVDLDLRRDDPYAAYPELRDLLLVPVAASGDAAARYRMLAEQVPVSVRLMAACLDRLRSLGEGPVDVLLPKAVRVPEGTTHSWMEGPLGIAGYLLASAGEKTPWRLKVRSASFNNVQAMAPALVGVPIERLADAVMSFMFVVGDLDR